MGRQRAETAQASTENRSALPDLHTMLAGLREQMEFMIRDQFAQVERKVAEALAERDTRLEMADALIERLREEKTRAEVERDRAAATLAKLRELALDASR